MRVLDLFAGTGSATKAFRDRGHEVITVELDPSFKPDIVADVRHLPIKGHIDFIWASPPCEEFSVCFVQHQFVAKAWRVPAIDYSFNLLHVTLQNIDRLKPRWWLIENTRGLQYILGRARAHAGSFYFWGDFPPFDLSHKTRNWNKGTKYIKGRINNVNSNGVSITSHKTRTKEYATVPYEVGKSLCVMMEAFGE